MFLWPKNILRDTPKRLGRLFGTLMILPAILNSRQFGIWLHSLFANIFDLFGGPEICQVIVRFLTNTRPMSEKERETAELVFGSRAIRYKDVRIASGGIWQLVFRLNNYRAFATWHTINIPAERMNNLPLIVHELAHVYQYERVGSVYIGQGLGVQLRYGSKAYDYGGADGLTTWLSAGRHYSDYNREQQGQIAQDYCQRILDDQNTAAYEPLINELRMGAL